eukprot:scaffold144363_cov17-Tisochrysis_lutea.AAC.1
MHEALPSACKNTCINHDRAGAGRQQCNARGSGGRPDHHFQAGAGAARPRRGHLRQLCDNPGPEAAYPGAGEAQVCADIQGRVYPCHKVALAGMAMLALAPEEKEFLADAFSKELDPARAAAEEMGRDLMQHEAELLKERTENARLMRTRMGKDLMQKEAEVLKERTGHARIVSVWPPSAYVT